MIVGEIIIHNSNTSDINTSKMFLFQEISDLFGADLPKNGGKCGKFKWVDGPLLAGLKAGHWIVLDEVIGRFLSRVINAKKMIR